MKILVLGSDGFVGKNLLEDLSPAFTCFGTSRRKEKTVPGGNILHFDMADESTWKTLLSVQPDCIVNCVVSGSVRKVEDVKHALDTNYLHTIHFFDFIARHFPDVYLIHFGTAFEYNLRKGGLTENSECRPRTYYGISKLLTSHYLLDSGVLKNFTIVRPFNLFGPYDKEERIIPHLICAQRDKKAVALTEGMQERDYFFVKDLSRVVAHLLAHGFHRPAVVNAGSGRSVVLKDVANLVAQSLPDFNPALWQWGKLPYRDGEVKVFYNASTFLDERGIECTAFEQAIKNTVSYYCEAKQTENVW